MQTTTLLTMIIASLVLAIIGLAVFAHRTASAARKAGYDQGFEESDQAHTERTNTLHLDLHRHKRLQEIERQEHQQALESVMQDADARIAIFAARTLTADDLLTLGIVHKQLLLAVQTYTNLQLVEQARFALTAAQRLEQLNKRIAGAFEATLPEAAA